MNQPTYQPLCPRDPATYRNTSVVLREGVVFYTLHQTTIAKVDAENITLNSGGYRTPVTKKRIGEVIEFHHLPYYLYQKKHVWYIGVIGMNEEAKIRFWDGMTLARTIRPGKVVAS